MSDETRAQKHLRKLFPYAHWQRIESWTSPGIFDSNGCHAGVEAWVENKDAVVPKTERGHVRTKVQPEQIAWEALRRQAGGRTFVAVMFGEQFIVLRGRFLRLLRTGITVEWLFTHRLDASVIFNREFDPTLPQIEKCERVYKK